MLAYNTKVRVRVWWLVLWNVALAMSSNFQFFGDYEYFVLDDLAFPLANFNTITIGAIQSDTCTLSWWFSSQSLWASSLSCKTLLSAWGYMYRCHTLLVPLWGQTPPPYYGGLQLVSLPWRHLTDHGVDGHLLYSLSRVIKVGEVTIQHFQGIIQLRSKIHELQQWSWSLTGCWTT